MRTSPNNSKFCTKATLKDCQAEMLVLLKIVDKVCRTNNIEYWLDGGTLLGAVRHSGFIPWDDDIDICVANNDYHKLLELLEKESQTNPNIFLYHFKNDNAVYWCEYFASTKILMSNNESCKLDIFPMRFTKKEDEKKDRLITDKMYYFMFGKIKYMDEFDAWHEKYYSKDVSSAEYMDYFNNEYIHSGNKRQDGSLVTYPFGDSFSNSKREYYLYSDIFPLKKIKFEGHNFFAPKNINRYLTILYGDYMTPPPKSQQKPCRRKFYFCNNTQFAINTTKQKIGKKIYCVEDMLTNSEIHKYKQELKFMRGSDIGEISLNMLSAFYVRLDSNKKYRLFKHVKNNITRIKYNFFDKISPILLVCWLWYKIRRYFNKTQPQV